MLPRTCPFFHSAVGSPCTERGCGGGSRNTAKCRAVITKYCNTKAEFPDNIGANRGKAVPTTDPACYAMVPRSCPFVASNTGSPCKAQACGSAGGKKSAACRATIGKNIRTLRRLTYPHLPLTARFTRPSPPLGALVRYTPLLRPSVSPIRLLAHPLARHLRCLCVA